MASSKDKAISLKDNYVAGLIEAGATAPMPTMSEQDMGDTASVFHDLDRGRSTYINDGIPIETVYKGNRISEKRDNSAAMPNSHWNTYDMPSKFPFGLGGPDNNAKVYAEGSSKQKYLDDAVNGYGLPGFSPVRRMSPADMSRIFDGSEPQMLEGKGYKRVQRKHY